MSSPTRRDRPGGGPLSPRHTHPGRSPACARRLPSISCWRCVTHHESAHDFSPSSVDLALSSSHQYIFIRSICSRWSLGYTASPRPPLASCSITFAPRSRPLLHPAGDSGPSQARRLRHRFAALLSHAATSLSPVFAKPPFFLLPCVFPTAASPRLALNALPTFLCHYAVRTLCNHSPARRLFRTQTRLIAGCTIVPFRVHTHTLFPSRSPSPAPSSPACSPIPFFLVAGPRARTGRGYRHGEERAPSKK